MQKELVAEWFVRQSQPVKNFALLCLVKELTLVVRNAGSLPDAECQHKMAVCRTVTECQHKMIGYVTAAMTGAERYPDELIISFACDYVDDASIRHYTREIWQLVVARADRFGSSQPIVS